MGKKILRVAFVALLVGVVIFEVVRVLLLPEEARQTKVKKGPQGLALEVRDEFAESVTDTLGGREAKLGLAYLVGMKDDLDAETQEMLRAVGLTHIVVASGTHLGIIVEFFRKRFGKISRFAGALFGAVFIVIFATLVGWTASITRAAIVSGLSILGWYYGRKVGAMRVILIAMAVTLVVNPLYALDLGWQLSFASFAGIMLLLPLMQKFFFGKKQKPGVVSELVLASVAATLMCAPILLYYFGSISLISLVANVLILPTIPFAMGMTFVTGLTGFLPAFLLFDWLRFVVVKITTFVLDYHLAVVEFFSKQTGFIINISKGQPVVLLLYIPILAPFVVGYAREVKARQKAKLRVQSDPERYLPFTTRS